MPARSKAQHGIMGMALALKRGKVKADDLPARVRKKVQRIASDMSEEQLSHYTSTDSKKLPRRASGRRTYINNVRAQ